MSFAARAILGKLNALGVVFSVLLSSIGSFLAGGAS
jgi:hypothetical protein